MGADVETHDEQKTVDNNAHQAELPGKWLQARYVVVTTISCLMMVFYLMRVNLSVAIVAMTDDSQSGNPDVPHYDWTSTERGNVLSSFFWGYAAMQIPAMFIVRKFGSKIVVLAMCIITSIVTILFVPASSLGWQGACAARVVLGITQAGLISSTQQLLSHWAPPQERSKMVVYSNNGQQIGTILGLAGAGVVSDTIGWPWVFYITGIMGLILAVAWYFLIANKPEKHPMASSKEIHYIQTSLASSTSHSIKGARTPWKEICTSVPLWSLILVNCSHSFGFWTLLTGIPSYMDGVLEFDLSENGFLSALPYLTMWILSFPCAWLADRMLKYWNISILRKVSNSIALYGAAVTLTVLSFIPVSSPAVVVAILIISVALNVGCSIGIPPNHLDLSPNFAATLSALTNEAACIMGIIGPLIVGLIVTDTSNEDQWNIVFLLTAGIYIVGNTIFIFFGSGKVQTWNELKLK